MALVDLGSGNVFYEASTTGSGTGNYNAFLRVQKNGTEEGYNTDLNKQLDNKDGIWTHTVLVSALQSVTVGGVDYYEIRLDLNEGNASGDEAITLTELQLYRSASPATNPASLAGLTSVFTLANPLALTDINTGSGTDDYRFLIKKSLFPNAGEYFTLRSEFSGTDGGFEEWRALASTGGGGANEPPPAITLEKEAAPTSISEGGQSVTFTYKLTSQSAATDPLLVDQLYDDNGTPDDTGDDIVLVLDGVIQPGVTRAAGSDADGDGLLDLGETWTYSYSKTLTLNALGTYKNIANVEAYDNEGTLASDTDDATVTGTNVNPLINIEKAALPTTTPEGSAANIKYTYTLTSQSVVTDPLTIVSLIDDNGTPGTGDDKDIKALGLVSGDANTNGLLDPNETWVYEWTTSVGPLNSGQVWTNTAKVDAKDDENTPVTDSDTATVTGTNVDPAINIEKTASKTSVQAGTPTEVIYTYLLTNTSAVAAVDPLTVLKVIDDMGTVSTLDDVDVFAVGTLTKTGGDQDALLEQGETWKITYAPTITLNPGQTLKNVATVSATDDEGRPATDSDDAEVIAYNLGHTPGYWYNNGAPTWDGNDSTFPKNGSWNDFVFPTDANGVTYTDLAVPIYDLNGDSDTSDPGEGGAGNRNYLMIGDWDNSGTVSAGENVLVISRADALVVLNASQKQVQDGRWEIARDVVASWLNVMAGSYEGVITDTKSVMHYIDEAAAFLIKTTDGDHLFNLSKSGSTYSIVGGSAVAKNGTSVWQTGFDFDGDGTKGENVLGNQHYYGAGATPTTGWDIMSGSAIHTGLDFYNNNGYIA